MTSEEIKDVKPNRGPSDETFWLKEIAYQLARQTEQQAESIRLLTRTVELQERHLEPPSSSPEGKDTQERGSVFDGFEAPVRRGVASHHFQPAVTGSSICGHCGGGAFHPIHSGYPPDPLNSSQDTGPTPLKKDRP